MNTPKGFEGYRVRRGQRVSNPTSNAWTSVLRVEQDDAYRILVCDSQYRLGATWRLTSYVDTVPFVEYRQSEIGFPAVFDVPSDGGQVDVYPTGGASDAPVNAFSLEAEVASADWSSVTAHVIEAQAPLERPDAPVFALNAGISNVTADTFRTMRLAAGAYRIERCDLVASESDAVISVTDQVDYSFQSVGSLSIPQGTLLVTGLGGGITVSVDVTTQPVNVSGSIVVRRVPGHYRLTTYAS